MSSLLKRWRSTPVAERAVMWEQMAAAEKDVCRDECGLTKQLIGLEGMRVEATRMVTGEVVRFWVGRSTGWQPCHLEVKTRRSRGGLAADNQYQWVQIIRTEGRR